ncbi:hypothetical protein [Microbulbifer sp. TRSA005]|uniref:hypothetical protein n=1 Tax=unclassified Microbulbifer TaxID=2619833 RepID=UPI0040397FFA
MSLIRGMEGIMTGTPDIAGITGTGESIGDTPDTIGIKGATLDTAGTKGHILDMADTNKLNHKIAGICGLKAMYKVHRVL